MSIYHLVYATHLYLKKSDIFVAIFPRAACSLPSVNYCCGHWATCVVIELMAWLLNCCVATEMIVVFKLYIQNKTKNKNWTAALFIDSRPNNLETLKSAESLRKSRNNLRDSKLVK